MKRTPLRERILPNYTRGEEIANMTTHIVGGGLGVILLFLTVIISAFNRNVWGIVGSFIYGISMIALYTVSSVYHGLKPGLAKKVMQVIDHCTIYLLIVGTYTPILLSAMRPVYPGLAWTVLGAEWLLSGIAATFTAIDHKKYAVFSMICYIGLGWCIVFAAKTAVTAIPFGGLMYLLSGGISYTIGAVLYGLGRKHRYMHSTFHLFVVLGSILQFFCIFFYIL